jgi:hypothetical protein
VKTFRRCHALLQLFERREFFGAIDALELIADQVERIDGSRAQLDPVEFTLLQSYFRTALLEDARRMLSKRHLGSSCVPVARLGTLR